MPNMNAPHNIYIHVPFCIAKCNYCAFYSAAIKPNWDKYATDIYAEIDTWAGRLGPTDVPTIFFGGGTPSLMPTHVFDRIINKIATAFHITSDAEITMEANPGTITPAQLDDFIVAGVNRLSVGVQSLDDAKLQFMGRHHTARDARQLLDAATARNIRVSADFIYGLPHDTVDSVTQMCRDINTLGLQHCSMYELTIEPSTPFGKMNLDMPSNSDMADMYCAIGNTLQLPRYEVSNYAEPSQHCRHNENIWDGDAYIGIGRGAAGRVYMNDTWYEQMGDGAMFSPLSPDARATEKVIMGLRQMRGAKITSEVDMAINWDWVRRNPDLIVRDGERLRVTNSGLLTLDHILVELVR